ncbi:TPA: ead/Ea22-like family protein [Klebsiella pneumoniae]
MTDITELAQSLENAASKALIEEGLTWFCEEQLSHEDGIALHKADAEFIALANPTNILALVEALEKAQQRIVELDRKNCELDSLTQRWAVERAENADRIAELESRTVKLPEPFKLAKSSSGLTYYYADEVDAALTAAGIKVEAE